MKPKATPSLAMGICGSLAALAVTVLVVTSCEDQERFRGRTTEQVKQACDPQRQTPEECSRTLDR
jgi:hypothetical protein